MNFCVDKVKTEFVNIIHADMWIAPNQDLELLKLYDNIDKDTRLIASSLNEIVCGQITVRGKKK